MLRLLLLKPHYYFWHHIQYVYITSVISIIQQYTVMHVLCCCVSMHFLCFSTIGIRYHYTVEVGSLHTLRSLKLVFQPLQKCLLNKL